MDKKMKLDSGKIDALHTTIPFTSKDYKGMPYTRLGSSGLQVSKIGLGTWKMGYPEKGDGSRINEKDSFKILDKAAESGVCFWDTANRYNNASGNSERIIGSWLKSNASERRNIILATKLGGCMDGTTPNHCGLSRISIMDSVYASLERLQVNHIDLLYFHCYDAVTPIGESLIAIEDLISKDVVRYFAVSNFTIEQLNNYRHLESAVSIRSKITAVQNQFDIINGESAAHAGVLEYSAQKNISFIAWSPLAGGLLTEKYLELNKRGAGDRLFDEGNMDKAKNSVVMNKIHQLALLAHQWNLQLNQLVIAYMLTIPVMGPVIAASANVDQLSSNALAATIALSDEQINMIKAILSN